jgi:uncharacterized repeat protein (TIGR03806 family)
LRAAFVAALFAAALLADAAGEAPAGVDIDAVLGERAPQTLAEYGLFNDAGAREPSPALTPYGLNTQLYSDGALKFRYLYLPPGASAHYNAETVFDFPVGAVLVKTFAMAPDMRRPTENVRFIETRLLIHQRDGWVARAYVWNEGQTEARLAVAGADVAISWIDEAGAPVSLAWHVPNRNQCAGCHSVSGAVSPIGPSARNLNRDWDYGAAGAENQLVRWSARGLLSDAPPAGQAPAAPDAFDAAAGPLESRARAYLDVNCAHCHNPMGPAHTSGLDLRSASEEPFRWGVRKRPIAAGRGSEGRNYSIDPGHPERSILVARMESLDPGVMMPELGRQTVDARGLVLIRDWIATMPADETP